MNDKISVGYLNFSLKILQFTNFHCCCYPLFRAENLTSWLGFNQHSAPQLIILLRPELPQLPADLMVWAACFFNRGLLSWINEKWVIPSSVKEIYDAREKYRENTAVQSEFEKKYFMASLIEKTEIHTFEFLKLKISSNWLTKNLLIWQRKNWWNWCAILLHQILKMD